MNILNRQLVAARKASYVLAGLTTSQKNLALNKIAMALQKNAKQIESANKKDLILGKKNQLGAKLDRLAFGVERVLASAREVLNVVKLPDPVGVVLERAKPRAGFALRRVTVPFGVIAMIYESRPNVTIDAVTLAIKSGNAVVLRGGSDAVQTNRALVAIMRKALAGTRVPAEAIQFIDSTDRGVVGELLAARGKVDVVIPRGGKSLIEYVVTHARVPVIETGASVVHLYVDKSADLAKAVPLIINSKCRRVSICNALDTLLVHKQVAQKLFAVLIPELQKNNVVIHADQKSRRFMTAVVNRKSKIENPQFSAEFLDYALNLKIVDSLDEAITHIRQYSLGHTEVIVAQDRKIIERFTREVDAACVYANLSTQFSDGGEFGLGAEIGISTQKLHARGPFALSALTTYKWIGEGTGQVRK
jgi:glutamate-5-semialdehyde dehydrogenase